MWSSDPTMNSQSLLMVQQFANDRLRVTGFVFLNEILAMLRLPKIREGQLVGWVAQARDFDGDKGVIRFIITKRDEKDNITLMFNVDGEILDKIDWKSSR